MPFARLCCSQPTKNGSNSRSNPPILDNDNFSNTLHPALDQGQASLRPLQTGFRVLSIPGRRIKLHPDDYYAMGGERGGIDERWFASTTPAQNGPLTSKDEGLSQVVSKTSRSPACRCCRAWQVIGDRLWDEYASWPMYSKFFDNKGPLPHHIHHRDEHAALVNQNGKPEAITFHQVNNYGADFPTLFLVLSQARGRSKC